MHKLNVVIRVLRHILKTKVRFDNDSFLLHGPAGKKEILVGAFTPEEIEAIKKIAITPNTAATKKRSTKASTAKKVNS